MGVGGGGRRMLEAESQKTRSETPGTNDDDHVDVEAPCQHKELDTLHANVELAARVKPCLAKPWSACRLAPGRQAEHQVAENRADDAESCLLAVLGDFCNQLAFILDCTSIPKYADRLLCKARIHKLVLHLPECFVHAAFFDWVIVFAP
ncbi:unnamed protein product [Prorocentrum cordatum]|uniref:Uncharacterized protein n=1 Tax=Prorocentrum cordatum TaxID=2364126 RepID=A0ABN9VH95_9DINO|nr:unnamed protein product [Polarella glacialis]